MHFFVKHKLAKAALEGSKITLVYKYKTNSIQKINREKINYSMKIRDGRVGPRNKARRKVLHETKFIFYLGSLIEKI